MFGSDQGDGNDEREHEPFQGGRLGDLGSLGDERLEGSLLGETGTALGDRVLSGELDTSGAVPFGGLLEAPTQPVNEATMECHRGPCIHLWRLVTRMEGLYDATGGIRKQAVRQCNAHYEPTSLTEENVYQCSLWWPGWLSFVPMSLRSALRPRLRKAWERVLRSKGYDFTWRTWPDDVFEADDAEGRKRGGLRQARPGLQTFKDEFEALLQAKKGSK